MTTIYEVLRRPIETEKSRYMSGKLHQYVFEVDRNATKSQVKEAVQTLFDVEVVKINTVVLPAK
ncbi:MAG: 50S ribosomal protein L23, partial [Anaerolineales bacterium]